MEPPLRRREESEAQGVGWLEPLLTVAEVPSLGFRLRMLIVRLLVLRLHLFPTFLHARHARMLRLVANTMPECSGNFNDEEALKEAIVILTSVTKPLLLSLVEVLVRRDLRKLCDVLVCPGVM